MENQQWWPIFLKQEPWYLLARLARHPQWITPEISKQLLEVRVVFLPEIAVLALHKQIINCQNC